MTKYYEGLVNNVNTPKVTPTFNSFDDAIANLKNQEKEQELKELLLNEAIYSKELQLKELLLKDKKTLLNEQITDYINTGYKTPNFFKLFKGTEIPIVQREKKNDIAADVYMENNEIPDFTKEELMQEIDLLKKSSNCDSVTEYKQKISKGEIINFSHAQIELWEMLEGKLQDLEDGE